MKEFEEKIFELRRIIQQKESTIQKLELNTGMLTDGMLIKYREVFFIFI